MLEAIDRVLAAWRLSETSQLAGGSADDATIAEAERAIGRPLPDSLKALYRFADGISVLEGNLGVEPLLAGDDTGLVNVSDQLRRWHWPVPDQVVVFGGNGAGDQFGLWYPLGGRPEGPTPVVMIGAVFEPACFALVGTDLPRFLLAWSGYYLALLEAPADALDALGLPGSLRRMNADSDMAPYFRWADPALPDPNPDPYPRGLDATGIAALIEDLQTASGDLPDN